MKSREQAVRFRLFGYLSRTALDIVPTITLPRLFKHFFDARLRDGKHAPRVPPQLVSRRFQILARVRHVHLGLRGSGPVVDENGDQTLEVTMSHIGQVV